MTGKAPIIRKFPLIPGIDLVGRVLRSEDPRFQVGDRVVLNGYGLGEVHHGGYAEQAQVWGDWLIRLPENISTANAMAHRHRSLNTNQWGLQLNPRMVRMAHSDAHSHPLRCQAVHQSPTE